MHVLLVGAELEENLALRYLAAALQGAGHSVDFARFDHEGHTDEVLATLARAAPGLVGLSMTFQFRAKEFGALAERMRKAGYAGHITAGGHFPTFAHREALEAFPALDSIVRHEGEVTVVELCQAVAGQRAFADVLGLAFRAADGALVVNAPRPLLTDLDAVAFPTRTGEPQLHLGIPAAFLVGSRGCYGHCTFCCIHAYIKEAGGPVYRLRSAENLADEMAELRRTRGARMFVFHDDDFFTRDRVRDLARVTALRDALLARGVDDIACVVKARPDDVDAEVFSVLEEIGLLRVYLGIEAGSTDGLRVLGRGVDLAQNRSALALLRERDVYTCFNMLAFDPESSLRSLRESFGFIREHASVPMNFCRTEIYVGTPLQAKLAREGRLIGDVFGWDYVIREPAAERAFRVFASAFHDRNFRCDGLMNSTLGLGYHLHLCRMFYPEAMSSSLRRKVDETIVRVNLDCVERMNRILDFAATRASEDPACFQDYAARATEQVERANGSLEDQVADATSAIIQAVTSPRPQKRAVPVWQVASAAAIATLPLGCDPLPPPPPPDPLPVPTLVLPDRPDGGFATPPPPDPLPPPTVLPPPDPPPPPMIRDAGTYPPVVTDPLPPPTQRKRKVPPPPPPPDPLPAPKTNKSPY
jgi:radical SAM superfamily enzyme YgiQ (UPF0313 family)